MLIGKSIFHVNQNEGVNYSFHSILGYYNDLSEKVTKDKEHYNITEPFLLDGQTVLFPISIFQYGLGAYDLYLSSNNNLMYEKFISHANWALINQNDEGGWSSFHFKSEKHSYSAMAQGEGISLLLRAYTETKNQRFLDGAKNALNFMLKDISNGGTAYENDSELVLLEFTDLPVVYNGWMFAIFGLIDYLILVQDPVIEQKLQKTINTLRNYLSYMDNGYWSMYRKDKTIASRFYHKLHIAQLSVLYKYTKDESFNIYALKFKRYDSIMLFRLKAFVVKVIQKIKRKDNE